MSNSRTLVRQMKTEKKSNPKIGKKGLAFRRILRAYDGESGREVQYHATKGWRTYRISK